MLLKSGLNLKLTGQGLYYLNDNLKKGNKKSKGKKNIAFTLKLFVK